jgi:hypothetical protein
MPNFTVTTTIAIGLGLAILLSWLFKYWSDNNSSDLGSMSEKWVAENKTTHP